MINDFQLIEQSCLQQRRGEAGKVPAADDWRQAKADAFLLGTGSIHGQSQVLRLYAERAGQIEDQYW